jgi:hypothetical protein
MLQLTAYLFDSGSESLDELMSSVIQRLGMGDEKSVIQLLVSLNNLTSHCFQLLEVIL